MPIFNWFSRGKTTTKPGLQTDSISIVSMGGLGETMYSTIDFSNHKILSALFEKVASDLSQLKIEHWKGDTRDEGSSLLEIINGRVNELETPIDLFSKIAYRLLIDSNVFIYVARNKKADVKGLYICDFLQTFIKRDSKGELWVETKLENGKELLVAYDSVIHLKRRYKRGIYGTPMLNTLRPTLQLLDVNDKAVENQLKNSNKITGLLKIQNTLNEKDLKIKQENFINKTLNVNSGSQIGVIDGSMDYIDLKNKTSLISLSKEQSEMLLNDVYNFFNISPNIVSGNYSKEDYTVYLQTIIEPIAKALSIEFTLKLLTPEQRKQKQRIVFSTVDNELGDLITKGKFLESMAKAGVLTINEARAVVGKEPIEDGDVVRVSLNYVNHVLVDEYQLDRSNKVLEDKIKEDGKNKQKFAI